MKKIVPNSTPEFNMEMIVRALQKAVEEDVPKQLRDNHLETNNYIGQMRGDFINENLRNLAPIDGYELLPIHRFGWKGRLLVNRENKITLSIVTQSNLHTIPLKKRELPHYTISILHMQNRDLQGKLVQQSFLPMEPFDKDLLEADYNTIIAGFLNPDEGYRHYFVAYQVERNELVDVKLILMDPLFNIVSENSLNHLLNPDFTRLTDEIDSDDKINAEEKHRRATRKLSKLKPGLRKESEQA